MIGYAAEISSRCSKRGCVASWQRRNYHAHHRLLRGKRCKRHAQPVTYTASESSADVRCQRLVLGLLIEREPSWAGVGRVPSAACLLEDGDIRLVPIAAVRRPHHHVVGVRAWLGGLGRKRDGLGERRSHVALHQLRLQRRTTCSAKAANAWSMLLGMRAVEQQRRQAAGYSLSQQSVAHTRRTVESCGLSQKAKPAQFRITYTL